MSDTFNWINESRSHWSSAVKPDHCQQHIAAGASQRTANACEQISMMLSEITGMLLREAMKRTAHDDAHPVSDGIIKAIRLFSCESSCIHITDLNLSVRARKAMNRMGIQTVGDIVSYTKRDFLNCKNFGITTLNEIVEKLSQVGVELRD